MKLSLKRPGQALRNPLRIQRKCRLSRRCRFYFILSPDANNIMSLSINFPFCLNPLARQGIRGMGRLLAACAGLVVLTMAGCTPFSEYISNGFKVGPNYHEPPAAVAANWLDAGDVRIRRDSDGLTEGWGDLQH